MNRPQPASLFSSIIVAGASRLAEAAPHCQVLVIGDIMLDIYIFGSADRISPESPVPVVSVKQRHYIPGGAANVAANARALGANVMLAGIIGDDDSGQRLLCELALRGIATQATIRDTSRVTTTKTRVTAVRQHIVRFDEEQADPLPAAIRTVLLKSCRAAMTNANVVVLSDYAKGVFDPPFCRELIDIANSLHIPVVIDPKSNDFARYRGATVVTPNLKEAAEAAGHPIRTAEDLAIAAANLQKVIEPAALLITRSEAGMTLFWKELCYHFPALVNEVADVTGAGDTVVGMLAVALAVGISLENAADLANVAAAVSVSHLGTWAVDVKALLEKAVQ